MSEKEPIWHEGETFLQKRIGVAERMEEVGRRVVRDFMPDQHRDFYAQLPFIVAGSVDSGDNPWATFLEGRPGFMVSPTPTTLDIEISKDVADPASEGIADGRPVGLLGIELHTRRRNRMNGFVSATEGGLRVRVDQSFGNCPRYIQLRDFTFAREPGQAFTSTVEHLPRLDAAARSMINEADTFFVTSFADREDRRQIDVSHRGGNVGFVRIDDDDMLTIPDFDGNLFFATLGNIFLNGKAGLLFVDFVTGDMLQMTGDAAVMLDSPEIAAFQGAEQMWTFRPRHIVRRTNALALRWAFREHGWSPSSLMTGSWKQAGQIRRAAELAAEWRPLIVTQVVEESETIRSIHLEPGDAAGLLPHAPGQHLPIRVTLPGSGKPIVRSYSLSVAPSDGEYRISVRRNGTVSGFLHEGIATGDIIEARAPAGSFTMDAAATRPAVLLAGGIGITPLLAMLRHAVYEGLRKQRIRPVTLFYAARSLAERAFDKEIEELADTANGSIRIVRILNDTRGAKMGGDYDAAGWIDMALLTRYLPFGDYDFYLCGPPRFTQSLYDGLRGYNIADDRIHSESFGPSSLTRTFDPAASVPDHARPATGPVSVLFENSRRKAHWTPGSGSLLELAERQGLEPEFSCRAGSCGTCRTRLIKGAVAYATEPSAEVDNGEILLCCTVPADGCQGEIHLAI